MLVALHDHLHTDAMSPGGQTKTGDYDERAQYLRRRSRSNNQKMFGLDKIKYCSRR